MVSGDSSITLYHIYRPRLKISTFFLQGEKSILSVCEIQAMQIANLHKNDNDECWEILGFLSFMPFCTVFHSIMIIIYRISVRWNHFTWFKPMMLPIEYPKRYKSRDIGFMAIFSLLEYWCSILQHHEQCLHNSSQKLPFYMI